MGVLRDVTGFGVNSTLETTSRWSAGTLVLGIETSPLGSLIAPGGSGMPTTPDSDEIAVAEPTAFLAVTLHRRRWSTSADVRRYVRPFAPAIAAHSPPEVLQRSQPYENAMGCLPLQLPGWTVSTESTSELPWTSGIDVFTGGPTTTEVGFDAAVAAHSAFVAVTRTRRREPTSALATTYRCPVAPMMSPQSLPSGRPPSRPQRTHRYA
jgi:hypothetical protein